jgi:biopolymer transport protein ExbD
MQAGTFRSFANSGSLLESSYKDRAKKPAELMLVPMIDIFTVLVTFLLMTAVFSRLTIMQLQLPSATDASAGPPPAFRLEVIVRKDGFELTDGADRIGSIPKLDGKYDFEALSAKAVSLKRDYPKAEDASVLLERDIEYDYLIQVMDTVRSAYVPVETDLAGTILGTAGVEAAVLKPEASNAQPRLKRMPLFANIAVGEAP